MRNEELVTNSQSEFSLSFTLFRGKGVTTDTPGETYRNVSNGVRLAGRLAPCLILNRNSTAAAYSHLGPT